MPVPNVVRLGSSFGVPEFCSVIKVAVSDRVADNEFCRISCPVSRPLVNLKQKSQRKTLALITVRSTCFKQIA
jgi:hypothetical protein